MPSPRIKHVRAFTVRGGGADYHDQARRSLDRRPHRHADVALSGVPAEPAELRPQRAGHAGGRDRGRATAPSASPSRPAASRRLDRREAPGPLPRGRSRSPTSRRSGTRCITRRCSTVARASCSTPSPASTWRCGTCSAKLRQEPVLPAAGRRGARRAGVLRHRRAPGPRQADGLHRRQDAAAPRPRRRRRGPAQEPGPSSQTMRDAVGADFWLMFDCWMCLDLDYATRLAHAAHELRPEVDRGGAAARRLLGLSRPAQGRARAACW